MKRIVVIPGVGAGREVIEAALPILRSCAGGVNWGVAEAAAVAQPAAAVESALRGEIAALSKDGGLDEKQAKGLQDGQWPLVSSVKRALALGELPKPAAARLWECFPVDLPAPIRAELRSADAGLFGATGPGTGAFLLWLRQGWPLYANVRPVFSWNGGGVDLVVVRENTEGLYVQVERGNGDHAEAMSIVTRPTCERIARYAAALARRRRSRGRPGRVTIVHKANVLKRTDGLFRQACAEVLEQEGVPFDERHVDACALELVREPRRFDVILTTNLYGDILSDVAAAHMGGLGVAPSGNYGDAFALFEPVHGSAPDIAGRDLANPAAALLSGAMLLEHLGLEREGGALRQAVCRCLSDGRTTPDLGGRLGTRQAAQAVGEALCGVRS